MANKPAEYCSRCGAKLERVMLDDRPRERCASCGAVVYVNPLPVVSSILPNDRREILLVLRKKEPYSNQWCLPMGFAEIDENIQDAALRELEEETSVKGRIIRLLDAETTDDSFYGNLAILCYEVEHVSGEVRAGDDALDARFFPIDEVPRLAFPPNDRAVEKFRELYRDLWKIQDSFAAMFPKGGRVDIDMHSAVGVEGLLSDLVMGTLEQKIDGIIIFWLEYLKAKDTAKRYLALPPKKIYEDGALILTGLTRWMRDKRFTPDDLHSFVSLGSGYCAGGIPAADVMSAFTLFRKAIWQFILGQGFHISFLELYRSLEVNNRVVLFFDKAIYHMLRGYEK